MIYCFNILLINPEKIHAFLDSTNVQYSNHSVDCECDGNGTKDNVCNKDTGLCTCKEGYANEKCNECKDGFYSFPQCHGK